MNEMKEENLATTEAVANKEVEDAPQVTGEVVAEVQEETKASEAGADVQQKEIAEEAEYQQQDPAQESTIEDAPNTNIPSGEASESDENTDASSEEEIKEETMEDFDIVTLRSGQIVTGKIIRVTDDELFVNVGYKSDGVVSIDDIMLEEEKPLTEVFHEGDDIEVEVRKVNDGEGNVILSQKNIVKNQAWKLIEEAFENEQEIIGIGKQVVKGGLLAKIKFPCLTSEKHPLSS
jgi:predicted RNA-binding protein with RPS1 domain